MKRILVLAGVLAAGPALAQEVDCTAPQLQMEMTYCAEQDYIAADKDLNAAYGAARSKLRAIDADLPQDQKGAEEHLKQAQRSWISFRDAACTAEGYKYYGGSMEPMVIYACQARLTAQRAADLWALAAEG